MIILNFPPGILNLLHKILMSNPHSLKPELPFFFFYNPGNRIKQNRPVIKPNHWQMVYLRVAVFSNPLCICKGTIWPPPHTLLRFSLIAPSMCGPLNPWLTNPHLSTSPEMLHFTTLFSHKLRVTPLKAKLLLSNILPNLAFKI